MKQALGLLIGIFFVAPFVVAQSISIYTEAQVRAFVPEKTLVIPSKDPATDSTVTWGFDPLNPDRITNSGRTYTRSSGGATDSFGNVTGSTTSLRYQSANGKRYYLEGAVDKARWDWIRGKLKGWADDFKASPTTSKGDLIRAFLDELATNYPQFLAEKDDVPYSLDPQQQESSSSINILTAYKTAWGDTIYDWREFPEDIYKFYSEVRSVSSYSDAAAQTGFYAIRPGGSKTYTEYISSHIFGSAAAYMRLMLPGLVDGNLNDWYFYMDERAEAVASPELMELLYDWVVEASSHWQVHSDGSSAEGAHYQSVWWTAGYVESIRQLFNYRQPNGDPVQKYLDLLDHPGIRRTLDSRNLLVYPDGTLPAFHDSDSFENGTDLREFSRERTHSVNTVLPGHGCSVLGDGYGNKQFQALMVDSPWYSHGDMDFMQLSMFGYGRELFSDGMGQKDPHHAVSIGSQKFEWTDSAFFHNTAVVDGGMTFRKYAPGNWEVYAGSMDGLAVAMRSREKPYETNKIDMNQFRRCILSNTIDLDHPYVLDIFEVDGGQNFHDYLLHGAFGMDQGTPQSSYSTVAASESDLINGVRSSNWQGAGINENHYKNLKTPRKAVLNTAGYVDFRFTDSGNTDRGSRTHFPADASMELFLGNVNSAHVSGKDYPQMILRHRNTRTVFVAVHEPIDNNSSVIQSVEKQSLNNDTAIGVKVTRTDGRVDRYVVSLRGAQSMSYDGLTSDGVVGASASKSGKTDVWLVGGTQSAYGGKSIAGLESSFSGKVIQDITRATDRSTENSVLVDANLPLGAALAGQPVIFYFTGAAESDYPGVKPQGWWHGVTYFTHLAEIEEIRDEGGLKRIILRHDPAYEHRSDGKFHELFMPWIKGDDVTLRFVNQISSVPQVQLSPNKGPYSPAWTHDFIAFEDQQVVTIQTRPAGQACRITLDGTEPDGFSPAAGSSVTLTRSAEVRVAAENTNGLMVPRAKRIRFLKKLPARDVSQKTLVQGLHSVGFHSAVRWQGRNFRLSEYDLLGTGALRSLPGNRTTVPTLNQYYLWETTTSSKNLAYALIGYLDAPQAGVYEFSVVAQTSAKLWIDGVLVVDAHERQFGTWWNGRVALAAGEHHILVEVENSQFMEDQLVVRWKTPGSSSWTNVPDANLLVDSGVAYRDPVAIIGVDDVSFGTSDPVTFRSLSRDINGATSITSYQWSVDGTPVATGDSWTHTFSAEGTYTVTLTLNGQSKWSDSVQVAISDAPAPSGPAPLVWYKLDEASGTSVADASGNGYHGTAAVAPSWQPTGGKYDGAYQSTDQNYITVPASAFTQLSTAATISFWMKGSSDMGNIFFGTTSGDYNSGGSMRALAGRAGTGGYSFDAGHSGSAYSYRNLQATTPEPNVNAWEHWTLTTDSAANEMILYRNGAELARRTQDRDVAGITYFIIGQGNYGRFKGALDDFRIYAKALSPSEITAVMNNSTGPVIDTTTDSDSDGVTDFLEDAFGTDPNDGTDTPDLFSDFQPQLNGNVDYQVRNMTAGYTYELQTSTNLVSGSWQTVTNFVGSGGPSTVTIDKSKASSDGKLFLRIKVSK